MQHLQDKTGLFVEGHIKIIDPDTQEVFVNKHNAINYENISVAIANLLAHLNLGPNRNYHILEMAFGNGGVNVDATGLVNYKVTNTTSASGTLYNETYAKVVANTSTEDSENNMVVNHTGGNHYSDIVITCTLDYDEPNDQETLDTSVNMTGDYIFDELGLRTQAGTFISHVIFHPVQKSANRKIQVIYTIRITAGS